MARRMISSNEKGKGHSNDSPSRDVARSSCAPNYSRSWSPKWQDRILYDEKNNAVMKWHYFPESCTFMQRSCLEHLRFGCQYQMYLGKPRRNFALEQGWLAVVYKSALKLDVEG
jgi:hypothetical protein